MRQFRKIFRFETVNLLTKKVYIGVTLFLIAVIVCVTFFPRVAALFADDEEEQSGTAEALLVAGVPEGGEETVRQVFSGAFPSAVVQIRNDVPNRDELDGLLTDGGISCAFLLDGWTSYTYCVENLSMYDYNTTVADEALQTAYRMNALTASGVPADEAANILSTPVTHETLAIRAVQAENYLYTYVMIFALYIVIMVYGQIIASNVAAEKSSRAMELLITSVDPLSMMFGKVLASCLAGFVQLAAVFGTALVCFRLNAAEWADLPVIGGLFNIPGGLFAYLLLFFVLGFLFYAFLYGAVGSTVSKLEDANTAVMPVTMLFVLSFIVVMTGISGDAMIDGTMMRVFSFLPFSSPMAMFARIAMGRVAVWEIVLSLSLLTGSVVGVGVLSAKIYRVGVLLYGARPKLRDLLKAVRNA